MVSTAVVPDYSLEQQSHGSAKSSEMMARRVLWGS